MPATNPTPILTVIRPSEPECKSYLIDTNISNVLKQLGVRPKCSGFKYLKDAIKLCYESEDDYYSLITKRLYPEIAVRYRVKSSAVERAIRYVISDMYCTDQAKYQIIGYAADGYTNKEFISSVTEYLKHL